MDLTHIGRYEIHEPLGRGGMGTVYKARDPAMDRWVAVKTITVQDTHQRARFQQEVRAAGALSHSHITTIYDVGEKGDLAYIVMELVEGDTLAGWLSPPVPWVEAANVLLPICQALAYAHQRGVIHRDVKPANILISTEKQVKLTDFGVARLETALRRITESGSTVGTPLYTAPEQIRNEEVDGRADLFSLGVVLFELITGQHPFTGETLAQVVYRITQPEPINLGPLARQAPPTLVELIGRALQKEAAHRFSNADEMAASLITCLEQPDAGIHLPLKPTSQPASPTAGPVIDLVASNLTLSPTEEMLLRRAFAGHDRIYVERKFSSGYSDAKVLLVTPVRSGGRRLAQAVLKLDTPAAIDQEWEAYQKFVQDTLPPVTARILEAPVHAANKQLALLRYTFAGGLGSASPESLRTYYAQHTGEEVAALLENGVFRTFGSKWWLQRQSTDLILRRQYDRLLPVHLVLAYQSPAEVTTTPRNLVAGETFAHTCSQLQAGQIVQLQDFTVEEVQAGQEMITVWALPPSDTPTNPIRVRVTGLFAQHDKYQVGQKITSLTGAVITTRDDLLRQLVEPALPGQNLNEKQLTFGSQYYPNPLYDYEALLNQRILTMTSIIHGDLNLENILVTPSTGVAWLIDFATTREGHNLSDFMHLESEIITKLVSQTNAEPEAIIQVFCTLHESNPSLQQVPTKLQKPFVVLAAVRRMVRACMYNRENWDEYYLGLIITLLGSLKFRTLDTPARRTALVTAATLRGLISMPSLQLTPLPKPPQPSARSANRRSGFALVAVLLVMVGMLVGLGIWSWQGISSPGQTPTPISAPEIVVNSSPSPTPTTTPTLTPTPFPTPTPTVCVANGTAIDPLDIRSGPGKDYPTLGSAPAGNPVRITGRTNDNQWWQIADPRGPGGYGWASVSSVEVDETCLPPTAAPPTIVFITPNSTSADLPTPTSVPTEVVNTISSPALSTPIVNVVLENFEAHDTSSLRQTYTLNNAWDKNDLSLDVTTLANAVSRGQVLAMTYYIKASVPDNYVGFQRNLSPIQDWSNFETVQFWIRNDAAESDFVFQFGEAQEQGGEVWKTSFTLEEDRVGMIELPLTAEYFNWADWSAEGNKRIDLSQISYYAFFVAQAENNSGTIYLDSIEFIPKNPEPSLQTIPELSPTPVPAAPTQAFQDTGFEPAPIFAPLWNNLDQGQGPLGYPLGSAITNRNYARQFFERGFMFWWEAPEDPQPVWAIYLPDPTATQGDNWHRYDNRWIAGQPLYPPACPEAGPPHGPQSGFGVTWCDEFGVRKQFGRPLDAEVGSGNLFIKGAVQFFQGGIMFENPADRQVWALIDNNGWYRLNY